MAQTTRQKMLLNPTFQMQNIISGLAAGVTTFVASSSFAMSLGVGLATGYAAKQQGDKICQTELRNKYRIAACRYDFAPGVPIDKEDFKNIHIKDLGSENQKIYKVVNEKITRTDNETFFSAIEKSRAARWRIMRLGCFIGAAMGLLTCAGKKHIKSEFFEQTAICDTWHRNRQSNHTCFTTFNNGEL
jgi:hypothetical protein